MLVSLFLNTLQAQLVKPNNQAKYYQNPVIPGKFGDPSVVKVGTDYYMTHSGGGTPSLLIWHSKNLVDWQPLDFAAKKFYGSAWAPDLVHCNGKFYIYITFVKNRYQPNQSFRNYVLVADKPEGPWSEPIDIDVPGKIDPGHIQINDGKRYLFFNKGWMCQLDSTGTKRISELKKVYDGWQYPEDWVVECFCDESPKLFYRNGYYYLVTAQGGTTGPSTSHMAVVARSKNIEGPWQNSPNNPLLKTYKREEKWWSQGHATLLADEAGKWWAIYHAYENSFKILGRPTLVLPIEWTNDGWPIVTVNKTADDKYPKPAGLANTKPLVLSDDFAAKTLGWQWRCLNDTAVNAYFNLKNHQLIASAVGKNIASSAKLACFPMHHKYEASIHVQLTDTTNQAGIMLYSDNNNFTGIALKNNKLVFYNNSITEEIAFQGNDVFLKMKNNNNDVAFYYSKNGNDWEKLVRSSEVSAYKPASITVFSFGVGKSIFTNFKYNPIAIK